MVIVNTHRYLEVINDLYICVYMFIFRILVQICKTQAFQKLNPAQFDLHDAVNEAIQVSNGSDEWGYDVSEYLSHDF